MVYDEQLADRVHELTTAAEAVTELRMFGGWCVTLHGNLAVGVAGDDLIVRVGPDAYEAALARPGVRPFDFTGRASRGWVFVDGETVRTRTRAHPLGGHGRRVRAVVAAEGRVETTTPGLASAIGETDLHRWLSAPLVPVMVSVRVCDCRATTS